MAASASKDGYAITSQRYWNWQDNRAVSRSSLCEARQKISWQAFEYLLSLLQSKELFKWKGKHRVFAVDGSSLTLPASDEILVDYPRRTGSNSTTHYPFGNLVSALDVFSGQPLTARFQSYLGSERAMLVDMLDEFKPSDVLLLDRGFDGIETWKAIEQKGLHYVSRIKVGGRPTHALKDFLCGEATDAIVTMKIISGQTHTLRLIKVGLDRKSKPLVIGTNLFKASAKDLWRLYKKRWNVETMYYRVKQQLCLEKFHAKTVNGILQEIWANLCVLAWTSLLILGKNTDKVLINFKHVLRMFNNCVRWFVYKSPPRENLLEWVTQITKLKIIKQPGRHYPRISKQPANLWNTRRPLSKNRPQKWDLPR